MSSLIFVILHKFEKELMWFLDFIGQYEILGENIQWFIRQSCFFAPSVCRWGTQFFVTKDYTLDSLKWTQLYMGHMPAGISLQTLFYWSQLMNLDNMSLYDYGPTENQQRYGEGVTEAPIVDLSKVQNAGVPIVLLAATEDRLGTLEDVRWAREQIMDNGFGSDILIHYEEIKAGHISFFVGKDMSYMDTVLKYIKEKNPLTERNSKLTE